MDKNTRVTFWQPQKVDEAQLGLGEVLLAASNLADAATYTACGGARIRIERVVDHGDHLSGDFVRQQIDGLPPFAPEGQPLQSHDNPLGHRAVWAYFPDINILALQQNRPGVSPSAVASFAKRKSAGHRGFMMGPCLTDDALERLRNGEPKAVEMAVARPTEIARVEAEMTGLEESLAGLQEFVGGSKVTLRVGFERGERNGRLNVARVLGIARWATRNNQNVRKMKVDLAEEEPIDVFAEQIQRRGSVVLPNDDLDTAFQNRMAFLMQAFADHEVELTRLYG